MNKKQSSLMLSIIFITSLLLIGCGKEAKKETVAAQEVPAVTVQTVKMKETIFYHESSGTVKAATVSQVAPKVMGTVTSLLVKAGDKVKVGQLLATLENNESRQKLVAAEAGYREAFKGMEVAESNLKLQEITADRYRRLFAAEAIPRQQLDQIETQSMIARLEYERAAEGLNRASAEREQAGAYDAYSRLTAPTDGIITEKRLEVGNMLLPGVPVITVEDTSSFIIETYLEEKLLGKIVPGMKARVLLGADDVVVNGLVSETVPSVDSASRSFLVKIALQAQPGLHSGLYGKVQLASGERLALEVPFAAVVNKGELSGVYVLGEDKRIRYRMVRLGNRQDGQVEIIAGLKAGEKVVVKGVETAADGAVPLEVNSL